MIRRLFQGLLLTAASVLVSLLLAEGLLHLFPGLLPVELQLTVRDRGVAHPEIGGIPEPNSTGVLWTRDFKVTHQIDAHGFRNPGPWPQTADIVAIGDSLTFGYGVEAEAAWPRVIAARTGLSVVNLGLIGAGPQQHLRLYETFGRDLSPSVLLIGVFVANDFWDAEMFDRWERADSAGNYLVWRDFGRPTAEELARSRGRLKFFIDRESRLYQLVRYGRRAVRNRLSEPPITLDWHDGTTLQLRPAYLEGTTRHAYSGSEYFEIGVESLRRIHDEAAARGTRTLVVLQPSKEETYLMLAGHETPDPGRDLRAALDELGIDYVDLGPLFRARAEQGELLFFATDGHPNAAGYRLVAEGVVDHLTQRGLLDATVPGALSEHR